MLAAEAVKIISAISMETNPSKPLDVYALSYNGRFSELIKNLRSKWFLDYKDLKLISSFNVFLDKIVEDPNLDPEEKRSLENQLDYYNDRKFSGNRAHILGTLLYTVAKHLQKSGKKSIIMIDEIEIDDVNFNFINPNDANATKTSDENSVVEVDFRNLSRYTDVHFIMSLRPTTSDKKQFKVKFVKAKNQYDQIFFQRHRCAKEVTKFLDFWQDELDHRPEYSVIYTRYPKIDASENVAKEELPRTFENQPGVIWFSITNRNFQKALEKIEATIKDLDTGNVPSVAILRELQLAKDSNTEKEMAKKLHKTSEKLRSGLHLDINFNGAEADVVVLFQRKNKTSLHILSYSRARRLLIIVTSDEFDELEKNKKVIEFFNTVMNKAANVKPEGLVKKITI